MIFTFEVALFREYFPAFVNPLVFTDQTLQMYWDTAILYIDSEDYGYLNGNLRFRAINLLTAHLTALSVLIANGETPGLLQSAVIDKVNVSLTPPPVKSQFKWWLSLTPYGQQLLALLSVVVTGGFYIGGSCERLAFRKAGGYF